MRDIINFAAGPCQLSQNVLEMASRDILNYNNTRLSICEINHVDEDWKQFNSKTIEDTYNFLQIPKITHECFYMNGGATQQFSMICLNLCNPKSKVQLLISGYWSEKASNEINKYCDITTVYDEKDLVDSSEYEFTYFCENETVSGFEFHNGLTFKPKNHFIVCDMCSILGSKQINISNYGIIFSSLSKNLGVSGSTLVIAQKNILNKQKQYNLPIPFDWNSFRDYNNPKITPSFMSIYMTGINLERMIKNGGMKYYHTMNLKKSKLIYDFIDKSEYYKNNIPIQNRSRTNITFVVNNSPELSKEFTNQAKATGFIGTNHHRHATEKGCRISLYNGLDIEELQKFIDFMKQFQKFN